MNSYERLEAEIMAAINRVSAENPSNTPDHILAAYLIGCLKAWTEATKSRERWYGVLHRPGVEAPCGRSCVKAGD